MKIFVATDHAGFTLKNELVLWLQKHTEHEVIDCGAHEYDAEDDYPDFVGIAAANVVTHEGSRAVILGGSGQGEAMYANQYPGVRAVVYYGGAIEIIRLSRTHNHANVLSLGARFLETTEAITALDLWLHTAPAADEKYQRRIDKMQTIITAE